MQTFLPDINYSASAMMLDMKRLGKQRVECKQILLALGVPVGSHTPKASGWGNHPAVRMWRGCEGALCAYAQAICREWQSRGYVDNLLVEFIAAGAWLDARGRGVIPPLWLGDPAFHASHRSNLLRKAPIYYGKLGWIEPTDLPYIWPTDITMGMRVQNQTCKVTQQSEIGHA